MNVMLILFVKNVRKTFYWFLKQMGILFLVPHAVRGWVCLIQQTSIEAYDCIYDNLGDRQKVVYDVIEEYSNVCNQDISMILGLPINCITGRVKELRDKNFVCHGGYKLNDNGRHVMTWKVK